MSTLQIRNEKEQTSHIELLDHDWKYNEKDGTYSHSFLMFPLKTDLIGAMSAHRLMIDYFANDENEIKPS